MRWHGFVEWLAHLLICSEAAHRQNQQLRRCNGASKKSSDYHRCGDCVGRGLRGRWCSGEQRLVKFSQHNGRYQLVQLGQYQYDREFQWTSKSKKKSTSTSSGSSTTSDPTSVTYSLAAFAIGDWGTTVSQDSCCTRSSTYNDYDINAEDIVANLMDQQAGSADVAPKVSIDISNVDSGDADTHGAQQTCCQCYGYAGDDDDTCDKVARGDDACCGGDTDMYDDCMAQFTEWSDDSRKQLAANIANSTATWKIVNSHYNPYAHYAEAGMQEWFDIINGTDVHLWLNGHTHGENHDYSSSLGVRFVDNGAGGRSPPAASRRTPPTT
ncbi:unnamed protein product [Phytophthora lilii]|uniref:Unnamed protein product n=1 Tax=Phytophthora lilii TaxID=2077276 RepID=A0A9W6WK97_9STRA|nr:unnamed protein product [Phytophthora lilii]